MPAAEQAESRERLLRITDLAVGANRGFNDPPLPLGGTSLIPWSVPFLCVLPKKGHLAALPLPCPTLVCAERERASPPNPAPEPPEQAFLPNQEARPDPPAGSATVPAATPCASGRPVPPTPAAPGRCFAEVAILPDRFGDARS